MQGASSQVLLKRFVPSPYWPGGKWLVLREQKGRKGSGVVYDTIETFRDEWEVTQKYGNIPNG